MLLLDTDILIDCLRGAKPACAWLQQTSIDAFAIPGVAAMEFLMGCRNKADVTQVQKFISAFFVVWPDASDFAQAYSLLLAYRLKTGLSIPDCLIAAMSLNRNLPLCTFNIKHFEVIDGLSIKVSPKGQVTISVDARKQLGIRTETRLLEIVVNNCLLLIPQDKVISDILHKAKDGMKKAGLSAKELKSAINRRRTKNIATRYPSLLNG